MSTDSMIAKTWSGNRVCQAMLVKQLKVDKDAKDAQNAKAIAKDANDAKPTAKANGTIKGKKDIGAASSANTIALQMEETERSMMM